MKTMNPPEQHWPIKHKHDLDSGIVLRKKQAVGYMFFFLTWEFKVGYLNLLSNTLPKHT